MTFWQRLTSVLGAQRVLRALRFWPPYAGAGIRVTYADRQLREIAVEMKLRPWNQNYAGTHFGGSLYAMCDPFYMLMVIANLGPDYSVWDKSATIDFLKPGRGRVRARCKLTDEQLRHIRDGVEREGKAHPRFEVTVVDEAGDAVARVGKELSVRKAMTPVART
ncbi:MAG TPA: YiiD C-terminal domain-containing protein [Gemmatimonadales bacterium]|nr:YiiD C-terminal domain-containing protein [Gemmatimonadales bacterium]